MYKWQKMADFRRDSSLLNLHCLQKSLHAFCSERVSPDHSVRRLNRIYIVGNARCSTSFATNVDPCNLHCRAVLSVYKLIASHLSTFSKYLQMNMRDLPHCSNFGLCTVIRGALQKNRCLCYDFRLFDFL